MADESVQHQEKDAAEQHLVIEDLQQRIAAQESAAQQAQQQRIAQDQETRSVGPT